VRPIASAVPGVIEELLRPAPLSPGKVSFAWVAAVGPAIGRVTSVRLDGRTLRVIAADGHWAREVRRSSGMIVRRLERLLGPDVVSSLDVQVAQPAR
jgi:hypothetical protein